MLPGYTSTNSLMSHQCLIDGRHDILYLKWVLLDDKTIFLFFLNQKHVIPIALFW